MEIENELNKPQEMLNSISSMKHHKKVGGNAFDNRKNIKRTTEKKTIVLTII